MNPIIAEVFPIRKSRTLAVESGFFADGPANVMFNRSERRHHFERLKNKRRKYWGYGCGRDGEMDERQLGMVAATPKPCSCFMCRNPRKNGHKSLQEERALQSDAI